MNEWGRGYSPLPKEVLQKVLESWKIYKELIGLEGDVIYKMKQENRSPSEIEEAVRLHRIQREENIGEYHDLIKTL